jgi:hypothetical protein
LKHEQYRPAVLRIKHVLKLGQEVNAHGKRFLGARLVFGCKFQRIAGVDVLQAKTIVGYPERLGKLARLLDKNLSSLCCSRGSPRFSRLTFAPYPDAEPGHLLIAKDQSPKHGERCFSF